MRYWLWLLLLLVGCTRPHPDDCVLSGLTCPSGLTCNSKTAVCEPIPKEPERPSLDTLCEAGWCWDRPWIIAAYMYDVLSFANGDVWMLAETGAAVHRQQGVWSLEVLPDRPVVRALGGTAADDLWAVGNGIYHRTAGGWTKAPGSEPWISAVWSHDRDDAWAVGGGGVVLRWDGNTWSRWPSGTTASLNAVWGASSKDIWIAGDGGTILHWDGTALRPRALGADSGATFKALWGSGSGEVWVSGSHTLRWDGAGAWATVPGLEQTQADDIWGDGAGTVWLLYGLSNTSLTRFDTRSGAVQNLRLDAMARNVSGARAIAGSGARDIWLVGPAHQIYHYDGEWQAQSQGQGFSFIDIAVAGDDVYAVNQYEPNLISRVAGVWREEPIIGFGNAAFGVRVGAASPAEVWVSGLPLPGVARKDGATFVPVPDVTADGPIRVFGPTEAWVYSRDIVARWDGQRWTERALVRKATEGISRVWGASPRDVWGVSEGQQLHHFDGEGWSKVALGFTCPAGQSCDLFGVWGIGDEVYVVGRNRLMLHKAGRDAPFQVVPAAQFNGTAADMNFLSICGLGRDDIWIGGIGKLLVHYDGSAWSAVPITGGTYIHAMSCNENEIWAAGVGGRIMHHRKK